MPPKILLVEDNPADVKLIRLALQSKGIVSEITHFDDGLEVVEALFPKETASSFPVPDLVLLDLNMPRVDGLELLRKFRENERFKQVLIAICTSSSSPQDQEDAMSLGANAYIRKPIELEPFLNDVGQAVKEILDRRKPALCRAARKVKVRTASAPVRPCFPRKAVRDKDSGAHLLSSAAHAFRSNSRKTY